MATRRKVFDHERAILVRLYLKQRVPVDQYEVRQDELRELSGAFNTKSGRDDAAEEILHYMRTERKLGRWPRLDGKHKSKPPQPPLSADETEMLVEIYTERVVHFDHGSDEIAYDPEIAKMIASAFLHRTGRRIPRSQLIA